MSDIRYRPTIARDAAKEGLMTTDPTVCPECGSHETKIQRSWENWFRGAATALLVGVALAPVAIRFRRVCLACGTRYAEARERTDYSRCAQCDYIVSEGTARHCPECGWKLPHPFLRARAKRRKRIENEQPPMDSSVE
jgi:DNA-directed RNA polymerase subunit RPC12/RpoP